MKLIVVYFTSQNPNNPEICCIMVGLCTLHLADSTPLTVSPGPLLTHALARNKCNSGSLGYASSNLLSKRATCAHFSVVKIHVSSQSSSG